MLHKQVVNITIARRKNALALFQDYAEKALASGVPPKGLEQAFAAKLQISPEHVEPDQVFAAYRRQARAADRSPLWQAHWLAG